MRNLIHTTLSLKMENVKYGPHQCWEMLVNIFQLSVEKKNIFIQQFSTIRIGVYRASASFKYLFIYLFTSYNSGVQDYYN